MARKRPTFLLTTTDNPFNPFTQFREWYFEDIRLGYNTCALMARMTLSSEIFDDDAELYAIYDIISNNFSGKHIAVTKDEFDILINNPD